MIIKYDIMYIVNEREVMIMYTVEKVKYGWAIFKDGVRIDEHATREKKYCEIWAELCNLTEED